MEQHWAHPIWATQGIDDAVGLRQAMEPWWPALHRAQLWSQPQLGGFRGMLVGIGPRIGFLFPVGDYQGYLNVKGYKDLAVENRPEGWSTWVTFDLAEGSGAAAIRHADAAQVRAAQSDETVE